MNFRRRWLIAGAIAGTLAGGGRWLSWPHNDERLIGRWQLSVRLMGYAPVSSFDAEGSVDRLVWRAAGGGFRGDVNLRWSVNGNELIVRPALPRASDLRRLVSDAGDQLLGRIPAQRFEIVELTPNRLRFRATGTQRVTDYVRLPAVTASSDSLGEAD